MIKVLMALLLGCNVYPLTAKITEFDEEKDIVICESSTGIEYTFDGIEDYIIGDYVSLIVSDNKTPKVFDDIVLVSRYSGYTVADFD